MKLVFHETAWEDYQYWRRTDPKNLKNLNRLILECMRHPFEGTGKPEPLRGNLTRFWSRRLTKEHRLVYRASNDAVEIAQCRFHY